MGRTIKNAIRTILRRSDDSSNLRTERSYVVCNLCNRVVWARLLSISKQWLTGLKPTVAYICTFGCEVWAIVPSKTKRMLGTKPRSGI